MSQDKMPANKKPVDEMTAIKMPVDEMAVYKMTCSKCLRQGNRGN
jgi:hypothetical protein